MTERAARGSLSGRWQARTDGSPNIRGGLTLEQALPAGAKLWVSGWTKRLGGPYSGDEHVVIEARLAVRGPRFTRPRRPATAGQS